MIHKAMRGRWLASTTIAGAVLAATPSFAQEAASPVAVTPAAPSAPAPSGGEIVVTGTRISNPNMQAASPITSVSAQDVKLNGTVNVEDLLAELPQAFIDQSSNVSNGATGTATANLRNLGAQRTLVLIDGHRIAPGDPRGGGEADLNTIPTFLIKRVDVLTGGASATYGADAVAGVVNFVLDDNFNGFKFDVQGNLNQHDNNNKSVEHAAQVDPRYGTGANGISLPHGNTVDGGALDVGAAYGAKFGDDDRGHLTVYGGYHKQNPILQDARDFSACPLDSYAIENGSAPANADGHWVSGGDGATPGCSGSSNTSVLSYRNNAGNGPHQIVTAGGGVRAYNGFTDAYNYNPTNYFQRPDKRYMAGAFATYDISDAIKPYGSFMFMDDHSVAQIAPSGTFNNVFTVNCSNPLLTTALASSLGCTAPGAGSLQTVQASLGKRNVEGGGRIDDLRHTDYRFVGGFKGDIGGGFSFDAYYQYSTTLYSENYQKDFSRSKVGNAINDCLNPDGTKVADSSCAAYNIWTGTDTLQNSAATGVTQDALDYVQTPGFQSGSTREQVASATIHGDLGTYGIQSPFASSGVNIAFGPEYRKESLTLTTDNEFSTGDLLGQGGQTKSVAGSYDVFEGFLEVNAPIVDNKPGFQSLSLDGAYRRSHYNSVGNTNTWKIEANWAPFTGNLEGLLRFRGSYNHAVRAPDIQELYQPQQLGLGGTIDPCTGGGLSYEICARSAGGDANFASQYAAGLAKNPAGQYNSVTAGSAVAGYDLKPETAVTKTLGVVINPRHLLPGFTASIDYYDIKIKNTIATDGYNTILTQCLNTGSAYYCGLIHRDPTNGSLWLTPNGYIDDPEYNAGRVKTSGIDFASSYARSLGKWGRFTVSFTGSLLLHNEREFTVHNADGSVSGNNFFECKGYYGDACGVPNPKWRHTMRLTYAPDDQVSVSLNWRHIGATNTDYSNNQVGKDGNLLYGYGVDKSVFKYDRIPTYDAFDLAVTFNAGDRLSFRAGVNNLFDRDPPLIGGVDYGAGANNGNTYPGYFDIGREIFGGATFTF